MPYNYRETVGVTELVFDIFPGYLIFLLHVGCVCLPSVPCAYRRERVLDHSALRRNHPKQDVSIRWPPHAE